MMGTQIRRFRTSVSWGCCRKAQEEQSFKGMLNLSVGGRRLDRQKCDIKPGLRSCLLRDSGFASMFHNDGHLSAGHSLN